jgi:hypothetical protein
MKTTISFGLVSLALLLSGCGEQPQTSGTKKSDSKPWDGAQTGHVASGWKAGDQASWEEQLKVRSQGQNEYSRAPAKP